MENEEKPRNPMHRERVEITGEVVKKAAALAAKGSPQLAAWFDTQVRCLLIRQRGTAAKWAVKAYGTTRVIGDIRERHDGYLSTRAAREKAREVYAELKTGKPADVVEDPPAPTPETVIEAPTAWTFGWLCLRYQKMMSEPRWVNGRTKPSSAGTCDDIRLAFAKPSYQSLGPILVTELKRPMLNAARDGIASYRQRQKNTAYVKAAMTWAAENFPDESGLTEHVDPWWEKLTPGTPDAETQAKITTRRDTLVAHKKALKVDDIGKLLVAHEEYCAGRSANEKVSPGIRFGLWWVCFTANRRTSTVKLLRKDLIADDKENPGFGRASWPPDTMKAKIGFDLPLPPVVTDIALGSIADYTQLVANEHGTWDSRWVFASTRRYGRDPDNDDVSVFPNSLNKHIRVMREAGALEGIPYFSLHLARSVMATYIEKHVSPIAASLVLAHTMPETETSASRMTESVYIVSTRTEIKNAGMTAWTEALQKAVYEAGGAMPKPRETARKSKMKAAS